MQVGSVYIQEGSVHIQVRSANILSCIQLGNNNNNNNNNNTRSERDLRSCEVT